ncbi:hypothetical protein QR680_001453 [Steinernema hermaphroditum]|uniref:Uncharacterized protein n=1 Tax=Steinernema hermaphroditum TaxID=289476 RepID=A0AA39GYB9_9BILA|nr:hypothetical protein QR680_001453 [Steinernema hermaphroditum]
MRVLIFLVSLIVLAIFHHGNAEAAKSSSVSTALPNNDKTLLDLIYKKGYLSTNDKFPSTERFWWLPIDRRFNAHVLRVTDAKTKKTYSTYTYQTRNARSLCEKVMSSRRNELDRTSFQKITTNIQKCTVPSLPKQIQECFTTLAWFDGDWSSIDMESQCALKKNPNQFT